jgi:hypothetical protein
MDSCWSRSRPWRHVEPEGFGPKKVKGEILEQFLREHADKVP